MDGQTAGNAPQLPRRGSNVPNVARRGSAGDNVPRLARRGSAKDQSGISKSEEKKKERKEKVVREMVRREGKFQNADKKRKGSGLIQVVQAGPEYFLKVTNLRVENPKDVDLHLYLLKVKAKGSSVDRLKKNGLKIPIPDTKFGLFRGEVTSRDEFRVKLSDRDGDPTTSWKGAILVKHAESKPMTPDPLVYTFANFKDIVQDFSEFEKEIEEKRKMLAEADSKVAKSTWVPGKPLAKIKKLLRPKFKYFDRDGSGDIDLEEFREILENIGLFLPESRILKLLRACDVDGSGAMDMEELPLAIHINDQLPIKTILGPKDAFELFDDDNSGELDELELFEALHTMNIPVKESEVEEFFKKHDTDHSGTMDPDEFKVMWFQVVDVNKELEKRNVEFKKGMFRKKKNLALLKQVIEDEEKKDEEEFEAAVKKTFEEARQLRLEQERKNRVERRKRNREVILAKRAKAKEVRLEQAKRKREKRMREELEQEEKVLRIQLSEEQKKRAERRKVFLEKKRKEEISEEKRARARKGEDRINFTKMGLRMTPDHIYKGREAQMKLSYVVHMDLSRNKLEALPENRFFFWCGSLRKLNIGFNRLEKIPDEIGTLENLQIFLVNNNFMKTLPSSIRGLKKLIKFDLSGNLLKTLPSSISNLTCLQELLLVRNEIETLPDEINDLRALEDLDISVNKIIELPDDLRNLKNLVRMNMSWNKIRRFPRSVGELGSLQTLDLSNNCLKRFPNTLEGMTSLRILNAGRNELIDIPSSILGMGDTLLHFDASHNQIYRLPDTIGALKELQCLNLAHNRIKVLPPSIGQLKSLMSIDLRDNPLREMPSEIGALSALQEMFFTHNRIEGDLPRSMGALKALGLCDLSENCIEQLPESLGALADLIELNAARNMLRRLPPSVGFLKSLTRLDVSSNRLRSLPHSIGLLSKLEYLDASSNLLQYLPSEMGNLGSLEALDLHHNRLQALPPAMGGIMPSLKEFRLLQNPYEDLPKKLCDKWGTKEQYETLWSGYTKGQIVDWTMEHYLLYPHMRTVFEAHTAEYIAGEEGYDLDAFIDAIACRMDRNESVGFDLFDASEIVQFEMRANKMDTPDTVQWDERFVPHIHHFFFKARKLGVMPRFDSLYPGEKEIRDRAIANHGDDRARAAERAKEDQEAWEIKKDESYDVPRQRLIYFEEEMNYNKLRRDAEKRDKYLHHLCKVTAKRKKKQDAIATKRDTARSKARSAELQKWMKIFNDEAARRSAETRESKLKRTQSRMKFQLQPRSSFVPREYAY